MANVIKHKRGSGSDPAANNLVLGELAIRTDTGKLFTKMDSGAIAEIAGGGSDIAINTLSSSSGTGGGSATFNGSAFRFTLSAPPSVSAQQLLVSINGVIQKPVAGTGQPSEGFSVDGTDIILGDAPAAGSDFFILTFKSLGVSEPADNSVTSAKIVDGAIVNADINASAAIAGTKIDPDFGSQNITTTGTVTATSFVGDGAVTINNNGTSKIITGSGTANTLNGNVNLTFDGTTLDVKNGTGVINAGAITGSGDLTIDTNTLHVDSSNNRVGIGTTSPTSVLHVSDTEASGGVSLTLTNIGDGGSSTTPFCSIDAKLNPTRNGGQIRFGREGAYGDQASADSFMAFYTAQNDTNVQRMRIDSHGHVRFGSSGDAFDADWAHSTHGNTEVAIDGGGGYGLLHFRGDGSGSTNTRFSMAVGDTKFYMAYDSVNNRHNIVVDNSGNVGIGTTSPTRKLEVHDTASTVLALNSTNSSGTTLRIQNSGTDKMFLGLAGDFVTGQSNNVTDSAIRASGALLFATGGGSPRMTIDSSGNIGAPTGTNIFNASDSRVKTNVVDLDKGLTAIKSLRPVSFNWIDGFCDEEKDTLYGFIAQEVNSVDSNLIQDFATELTINENKIENVLRVNEKFIIPMLVKAIQELSAKVEALEAK